MGEGAGGPGAGDLVATYHVVVCPGLGDAADAPGEQLAGLDGYGRQLGLVVQHVPDGEDGVHAGPLLRVVHHLPALRVQRHAHLTVFYNLIYSSLSHLVEAEAGGAGVPADGEDHGVELVGELGAVIVLGVHPHLGGRDQAQLEGTVVTRD